MSAYELDDDLVRKFVALQNTAGWRSAAGDEMAVALGDQIPPPAPTKHYAVVRTDQGVYCRADNNDPNANWWGPDENWCRTDAIGRITEVLFEGVDL